ncbi:MAG: hypothetical protein ACI9Z3_001075 [Roseivirga sp.]|jgi:hypothetical protein
MKNSFPTYLIFMLFSLISCKEDEQSLYDQQFDLYIERYQESLFEVELPYYLYAVDLDACSSCTLDHLELIRELSGRQSIQFLIIGDTSAWSENITGLHGLDNFHFDVEKKVYSFQTNFGKPMILFRDKNKETKRVEVLKDLNFELDKLRVLQILK